jgi:hypothetical protein
VIQYTYYVSPGGDDSRTNATARHRSTPWRTIGRALQRAAAGDTVVVLDGTYGETAQVTLSGLTVVAENSGKAVVQPPPGGNGFTIEASNVTLDGFVVRSANTGISALAGANGLRLVNVVSLGAVFDGVRADGIDGVSITDSIVAGAGESGIQLRKVTNATVRNNLSYGNAEWGISLDNSPVGGETVPLSPGNLVAENTSAFNATGALRVANATGTVRDNLLTDSPGTGRGLRIDTPGVTLKSNGFWNVGVPIDPESYLLTCAVCSSNLARNPSYVNPAGADGVLGGAGFAGDDFHLAQPSAGQAQLSEAVDAGSASAGSLGITGSTATNGAADADQVDLGFHYGASSRSLP